MAGQPVDIDLCQKDLTTDTDTETDTASSQVFSTGTIHATVVCPTRSHATHAYEIYKRLGDLVDIPVCQLDAHDGPALLQDDRGDIREIKGSQATITIGTLSQLMFIARTDHDDQGVPALSGSGIVTITRDAYGNREAVSPRLFVTNKVVVIDNSSVPHCRQWDADFDRFKRTILPPSETGRLLIVIPAQDVDNLVRVLSCSDPCYLIKDTETSNRNVIPWQVIPHFAIPKLGESGRFGSGQGLGLEISQKLQLRKRDSRRFTTILVAGNRIVVEGLFQKQVELDKDFQSDAAYIHQFVDPVVVERNLRDFENGRKSVLFISADFLANIDLRVDQVIVHPWPYWEKSYIDSIVIAVNSALRLCSKGATYIYFGYKQSDYQAFANVYQKLKEIRPASVDESSFDYALDRLKDAANDVDEVAWAFESATEDLDISEKGIEFGDSHYTVLSIERSGVHEMEKKNTTNFESDVTMEAMMKVKGPNEDLPDEEFDDDAPDW